MVAGRVRAAHEDDDKGDEDKSNRYRKLSLFIHLILQTRHYFRLAQLHFASSFAYLLLPWRVRGRGGSKCEIHGDSLMAWQLDEPFACITRSESLCKSRGPLSSYPLVITNKFRIKI